MRRRLSQLEILTVRALRPLRLNISTYRLIALYPSELCISSWSPSATMAPRHKASEGKRCRTSSQFARLIQPGVVADSHACKSPVVQKANSEDNR